MHKSKHIILESNPEFLPISIVSICMLSGFFLFPVMFPCMRRFLPYLKIAMVDKSVATFFNAAVNSVIEERQTDKQVPFESML